jgi:hypothetical protein
MNPDSFPTKTCAPEYDHSLDPLSAGDTPASPGPLPPGGSVDGPGPTQRWPYGS